MMPLKHLSKKKINTEKVYFVQFLQTFQFYSQTSEPIPTIYFAL